ncbi:twin-arginine translocase TatA/TatE family subunit [Rhodovibrio salinarum]|uniref:Sec-independent protein translocase protein TatA n=1 Tax=Rhodovibrio salinarum TaxID=1087 RepID=A0A934QJB0_9PROT|nr:twin-arginine translocase TatA/TatE family subunit [Rhodovibrio salinarum]MBK1697742.1 twin-arginine translocase TatA/TatE family subunit [Rhodovibrio salinarum]
MGTFSIWHWLIVLAVVLILFGGGGKIPKLMKDMGSGINAFKKGLKDDDKKDEGDEADPKKIEGEATTAQSSSTESSDRQSQDKDRQAANG